MRPSSIKPEALGKWLFGCFPYFSLSFHLGKWIQGLVRSEGSNEAATFHEIEVLNSFAASGEIANPVVRRKEVPSTTASAQASHYALTRFKLRTVTVSLGL